MAGQVREPCDSQVLSRKGKEKERLEEPERDIQPDIDPETKADALLEIRVERQDFRNRVVLFASNFSFSMEGGGLVIMLERVPANSPDTQPRISIPEFEYRDLCDMARNQQYYYRQPSNIVRVNNIITGHLLQQLQLQLPADHKFLKSFDLLSDRGGPSSCLCTKLVSGKEYKKVVWCLKLEIAHRRTLPEILILLKHRMIDIIEIKKDDSWAVNESYSALFHLARTSYNSNDPGSRQILQDFCDGAGPSDYEKYAKRLFDRDMAYRKKYIHIFGSEYFIHHSWAHLYEKKNEEDSEENMKENEPLADVHGISIVERFWLFLKLTLDHHDKAKDKTTGKRKSLLTKIKEVLFWKKDGEVKGRNMVRVETNSIASGDAAVESSKEPPYVKSGGKPQMESSTSKERVDSPIHD